MTALLSIAKRFAIHAGVVAAGFALVLGFILIQDQREVVAQSAYQSARQQALDELTHAQAFGMTASELQDLRRQDRTIVEATAPGGSAPFNRARIDFFNQASSQELALVGLLKDREASLLGQTRTAAQDSLVHFIGDLSRAQQIGVDDASLKPLLPLAGSLTRSLNQATSVLDYRDLSLQLKAPMSKLALIIADQQTTNAVAGQFAAQVAAIDHGDPVIASKSANDALAQVRSDLKIAGLFQLDVSVIQAHVDGLAAQMASASGTAAFERIAGNLKARGQELQGAMTSTLPEKAIVISLKDQLLIAYERGQPVYQTLVTTGRPGLETDTGTFKVYSKQSPFTMHSPWPKGSPYWYPDTPVRTVMWFDGGAGIHDSSWRAYYGPGTQFPHYDPFGDDNGSHGCVNVPPRNMPWLWSWTPVGTPVIVY
ncbi:MAG TPA: L,D-transpeptidase [Candidatus Limnocylindrales bacterium]|nr:L,D-transpeptidase [Candidatus Limnocylindrales bacterium]